MISTNYPLYSVVSLGNGQIAIAGGGGASKTGVPNAVEIHRLSLSEDRIKSEQVSCLDTGGSAVMNCSVRPGGKALACGMDQNCALVSVTSSARSSPSKAVRERNTTARQQSQASDSLTLNIDVKKQSDFHEKDKYSLQKVVRFNAQGSILATGGADGRVRVWQYPSMMLLQTMDKVHTDDVDDLDFHPSQPLIVSVSCDRTSYVWRLRENKQVSQLKFTKASGSVPYKFRSCRFLPSLPNSSSSSDTTLVTTHSPVSFHRPPASYVCLWQAGGESRTWSEKKWVSVGKEPVSSLSCLASPSGRFIGVGTMMGSVMILDDSLRTLQRVGGVHSMYVTSVALTVLPSAKEDGSNLPVLVSVSDRTCCVTQIKRGSSEILMLVLAVFLIVGVFVVLVTNVM